MPIEQTLQEKANFFVQDKYKTVDINEQKDISQQKLYAKILDTNNTTI